MDASFRPYFPEPVAMPQVLPSTEPDVPWQLEADSMDWVLLSEFVVEDWLEEAGLELAHLYLGPTHDGQAEGQLGRELARQVRERADEVRRQRRALHRARLSNLHAVDVTAGLAGLATVSGPIPRTAAQVISPDGA